MIARACDRTSISAVPRGVGVTAHGTSSEARGWSVHAGNVFAVARERVGRIIQKFGDPSGIRIATKQRETTREVTVSVGDARIEIIEKSRRYGER